MFTLSFRKSRDNLSSSDVKLSSRITNLYSSRITYRERDLREREAQREGKEGTSDPDPTLKIMKGPHPSIIS